MGAHDRYLKDVARFARVARRDPEVERKPFGEVESLGKVVRTSLVRLRSKKSPVVEVSLFKPDAERPGEFWSCGRLVVRDPALLAELIRQLTEAKATLEARRE